MAIDRIASGRNGFYVNVMDDFADDTPWSITLRELRGLAGSVRFWALLAGVIAVLSLSGPFNTFSTFSLPVRTVYWTLVAAGSFGVGIVVSTMTTVTLEEAGLPDRFSLLLGGLAAGIPVAGLNALLQSLFFGNGLGAEFGDVLPYALIISVIVAFLYELAWDEPMLPSVDGEVNAAETAQDSVLVSKLPVELGKDVMHLQAQDHYVKVTTPRGSALVLMTLNEAERDLQSLGGMRVHRSWWVRRSHAARLHRRNGRLFVSLVGGTEIPVGRAYRNQVLAAFGKGQQEAA